MRVSTLTVALVALPLSLGLGSAGPAPTGQAAGPQAEPARPERQCFSPQQVQNFRTAGPTTVYLKVGAKTVYELQTAAGCNDIQDVFQMSIQPELGSRLCSGDWATLVVPGTTAPLERCRVQITKVLSESEVAALPDRSRP